MNLTARGGVDEAADGRWRPRPGAAKDAAGVEGGPRRAARGGGVWRRAAGGARCRGVRRGRGLSRRAASSAACGVERGVEERSDGEERRRRKILPESPLYFALLCARRSRGRRRGRGYKGKGSSVPGRGIARDL